MKVRWILAAREDRADIGDYIAAEDPRATLGMDELFSAPTAKLGHFAMLGREGKIPGTRELVPHENDRLVYEVDDVASTIWVMALVHTARRWPPVIKGGERRG